MSFIKSTNGNHYQFDDVTIDYDNFRVQKNGQNVALTPRAFDVLVFLLKNSGRVIEKQELFEQIWKDSFVSDNALTKIIKEIRQAINDNAYQPRYIETIQKRGYRFIAEVENGKILTEDLTAKSPEAVSGPVTPEKHQPANIRKTLLIGVIFAGLFIFAATVFVFYILPSETIAEKAPIDSIAVLPFENTTPDQNIEYISDGVTENIINTLSQFKNLRVLSRRAVFSYKNKSEDPYSIGRELNARAVLTGKIVKFDDLLLIQVDLIDVDRRAQIWGQQYTYKMSDIITTQNNIAREVVSNLRLKLTDTEQQHLAFHPTENPEAQKSYLTGLYLYNQATNRVVNDRAAYDEKRALCEKSAGQFQQAIELEPDYAQAYADLSRAFSCLANKDFPEYYTKAKEAVLAALRLDDSNASAHGILAFILWLHEWDLEGAEKEFKRTIELNPNASEERRHGYARLLSAMGRHDEAVKQIEIVEKLDPITLLVKADVGYIYKDARRYELALEKFKSVVEIQPDNTYARFGIAEIYTYKGMYDEAIAQIQELKKPDKIIEDNEMFIGWIYAMAGRRSEAIQMLKEYETNPRTSPILIASTYTALGDKDKAFFWLNKAYLDHTEDFMFAIKASPVYEKLRDDPRYTDLVQRVGLQP